MTERLYQVRAAFDARRLPRVSDKRARRKKQPLPHDDEKSPAERKSQLMRLVRTRAGRQRTQVRPQVPKIGVGNACERRIRERWKVIFAIGPHPQAQGAHEIRFAPAPETRA